MVEMALSMVTAVEAPAPVTDVGLTILREPQDAVIDIVFVHGLQGHPQNTWTYKLNPAGKGPSQALSPLSKASKSDNRRVVSPFRIFSKNKRAESGPAEEVDDDQLDVSGDEATEGKDVFWPRDLLMDDFPTARIMTFGYDTSITRGYLAAHQGNIFAHARDLLYALETKRRKAADRDLVFIAHSLGGILVKEMLRRSETDTDAKINKVFASTTGVFFFGTPHRGSKDWVSFGEGIAGVAGRLLGVDTNNQVIHALLPTSPELELCHESFMTQWMKRGDSLVVRTFQESKGVTGVRWGGFNQLIVPPDSSSLDHPNQRARTIDDNHLGMVKFRGKGDRAYEMVKEDIRELIERSPLAREASRVKSGWMAELSTQDVAEAATASTDNNAPRVEILTMPVRRMLDQDADHNQRSYDDLSGITLKLPYFDKSALTAPSSFPAPKRITRGNSAFELAETLQLLPGQSNAARLKLQELDLRSLVYDETSYYCTISLEPLIRLIIDHFTSVKTENNTLITRTKVGTFTFSRTTLGQTVKFSGRDRAPSSVSPPEQLFDAVKNCASCHFQRRRGAGLAFHEDYSHIPLIWESMNLEEALTHTDLEEPNCIRFMTKEDYDELQFQKNYASVILQSFVSVMEARAEDFVPLARDLDTIMILKDASLKKARDMRIVASGVAFAISAAVKANRQPELPSAEQDDSIYPRADRVYSQLYNRSRHIYSQQMSAFRRNRDEAGSLEALMAIAERNLSWAIWQACFASLTKANSDIISVNAVVASQEWIDLILTPDVDILMA